MQFRPENTLTFSYEPERHLSTTLILKNTSNTNCYYKFKVSTTHKFSIKPSNVGMLKANEEATVQIIIHRDIVSRASEEKIQIIYGANYEESRYFDLSVENGSANDKLNLTIMINEKEERIKTLEEEVNVYRAKPIQAKIKNDSKGNVGVVPIVMVMVLGLLMGFLSPITLFGK